MSKPKAKTGDKKCSVRIKATAKIAAKLLLKKVNEKALGRTIKFDELIDLALTLVTDDHLKTLQEVSLSNEDRKERLRQVYISKVGAISKDEWTGFTMTKAFHDFLDAQRENPIAA